MRFSPLTCLIPPEGASESNRALNVQRPAGTWSVFTCLLLAAAMSCESKEVGSTNRAPGRANPTSPPVAQAPASRGGVLAPRVITAPEPTPGSIEYYAQAAGGSLRMDPSPQGADPGAIRLKGTTAYSTLMFRLQKRGGAKVREAKLLSAHGPFDRRYLVKDGPGTYDVTVFGVMDPNNLNYDGLCSFPVEVASSTPDSAMPALGDAIIAFVDAKMGTSVGRGECWDLAQEALDSLGADWQRPTQFGVRLDLDRDAVARGDVLQFENVRIEYDRSDRAHVIETVGSPSHTAIVYEVLGRKHFKVAQQNVQGVRTVMLGEINLNYVVRGTYEAYRPVAGLAPLR